MELLIIGTVIGAVYGRNYHDINRRTYQDACKLATVLARTQLAIGTLFVVGTIVDAAESRRQKVSCMASIMCDCGRRKCPGKTVSISYYASKLKGAL